LSEHEEALAPFSLRDIEMFLLDPSEEGDSLGEDTIPLKIVCSYGPWRDGTNHLRSECTASL